MIRFAALNDSSESSGDGQLGNWSYITATKEAQESECLTLYNEALSLQRQGEHKHAENVFHEILDNPWLKEVPAPEEGEELVHPALILKYSIHKNLASMSSQREDYNTAMDSYLEAVALDSSDVMIWYKMGLAALKLENLMLAAFAFEQGLKCNSRHWPCLDHLCTVLYALNNYNKCLYYIAHALERDTGYIKGLALRKAMFREQPSMERETADMFKFCDPAIYSSVVTQEEYDEFVEEALNLRRRQQELVKPKPKPTVTFPQPLKSYSWKSLGECLLNLYDYASKAEPPITLGCRVDINTVKPVDIPIRMETDSAVVDEPSAMEVEEVENPKKASDSASTSASVLNVNSAEKNNDPDDAVSEKSDAVVGSNVDVAQSECGLEEMNTKLGEEEAIKAKENIQLITVTEGSDIKQSQPGVVPESFEIKNVDVKMETDDKQEEMKEMPSIQFTEETGSKYYRADNERHVINTTDVVQKTEHSEADSKVKPENTSESQSVGAKLINYSEVVNTENKHTDSIENLKQVAETLMHGASKDSDSGSSKQEELIGNSDSSKSADTAKTVPVLEVKRGTSTTTDTSTIRELLRGSGELLKTIPLSAGDKSESKTPSYVMSVVHANKPVNVDVNVSDVDDGKKTSETGGGKSSLGQSCSSTSEYVGGFPLDIDQSSFLKKGQKRKRTYPDEDLLLGSIKRRSARVRNTVTASKKKEEDVINYHDVLIRFLPSSLLKVSMNEDTNLELDGKSDESEKKTELETQSNESDQQCFVDDKEEITQFMQKHEKNSGVLHLMKEWLLHMSQNASLKWPTGLTSVYMQIYEKWRDHIQFPDYFCHDLTDEYIGGVARICLIWEELKLDQWLSTKPRISTPSPKKSPLLTHSALGPNFPGKHYHHDLLYLTGLVGFADILKDFEEEFCIRVYWLRAHYMMLQNKMTDSVGNFEMVKDLLSVYSMGSVRLANSSVDNIINTESVTYQLESLQRCQSLEEVQRLYDSKEYSRVITLLLQSVSRPSTNRKVSDSSVLERNSQLLLLLDCLLKTEDYKQTLDWGEMALNECLELYLQATKSSDKEDLVSTLSQIFTEMDRCLTKDKTVIRSMSSKKLVRLTGNLLKLVETALNAHESISDMPVGSVLPWILLYRLIEHEECKLKEMRISADGEMMDADLDRCMPSSMMLLKIAHEYLGRRSWCTNSNGALLTMYINIVSRELDQNEAHPFREDLENAIEQCFYCLYAHPNKKTKARHLQDHNASQVALTWPEAIPLYEYFKPKEIPEYDSYKSSTVSNDLENLLKRIVAVVPVPDKPMNTVESVTAYIDGQSNTPPRPLSQDLPVVNELFYLLADFHFKNQDPVKAIKFYIQDLCVNPERFDSWAGMALARSSRLSARLDSFEVQKEGPLFKQAVGALRCFKRALQIDESNGKLWIEYGALAYQLHSHASRQIKQGCSMDSTKTHSLDMLKLASSCYKKASECEDEDFAEEWLHHYMLGKIAEKLKLSPHIYFEHYKQAAKCLHEDHAKYPKKITYIYTPPQLAVESLEMYYRLHASALKYLLSHSAADIDYDSFFKHLNEAADGPFALAQEKKKERKQTYHATPQDHDYSRQTSVLSADDDYSRIGAFKEEFPEEQTNIIKNILMEVIDSVILSEECVESIVESVVETEECLNAVLNDLVKVEESRMENAACPKVRSADENGKVEKSTEITEGLSEKLYEGKFHTNEADNKKTNQSCALKVDNDEENMDIDISVDKDDANLLCPTDIAEELMDTTPAVTEAMAGKTFAEQPKKHDSVVIHVDNGANTDRSLVNYRRLVDMCVTGLHVCLSRYPHHYKAMYRLAHLYATSDYYKDMSKARDLLLGPKTESWQKMSHMSCQALFHDRKNHNFFNGVWKIPVEDVDRAGSFASHLYRSIVLLLNVLKNLKDGPMLYHLYMFLNKTPDAGKKFLRDTDRESLAKQAFSCCLEAYLSSVHQLFAEITQEELRMKKLLEVYKIYQHGHKSYPKELRVPKLLEEAYKVCRKEQIEDEPPILEQAKRYCQQLIAKNKPQTPSHGDSPRSSHGTPSITMSPMRGHSTKPEHDKKDLTASPRPGSKSTSTDVTKTCSVKLKLIEVKAGENSSNGINLTSITEKMPASSGSRPPVVGSSSENKMTASSETLRNTVRNNEIISMSKETKGHLTENTSKVSARDNVAVMSRETQHSVITVANTGLSSGLIPLSTMAKAAEKTKVLPASGSLPSPGLLRMLALDQSSTPTTAHLSSDTHLSSGKVVKTSTTDQSWSTVFQSSEFKKEATQRFTSHREEPVPKTILKTATPVETVKRHSNPVQNAMDYVLSLMTPTQDIISSSSDEGLTKRESGKHVQLKTGSANLTRTSSMQKTVIPSDMGASVTDKVAIGNQEIIILSSSDDD